MGTSDAGRRPAPVGDEAELFREFNARLVRIVGRRTSAPRETVDDACAFAWQQFLQHQPDRDRNWRGWLVTTAEREAWRLHGVEARHVSLSLEPHEHEGIGTWEIADQRDPVGTRARLREALEAFAGLPERRREIKALQITGFSYHEIAEMRGLTYTRVNRLLTEANAALGDRQSRTVAARVEGPPRAVRLDELEREPPEWLQRAIGRRPPIWDERRAVLAWRRAALAIDDYRRGYGRGLGDEPIGQRPTDHDAARAFDLARSAIERAVAARSTGRNRGRGR
jgi:DNA-directed RNA polymerase specialized sigma24 family protein